MSSQDCWRTIGTSGDRSCSLLEQHIHCHNCPVMTKAADRIRQRQLPSGYAEAALEAIALPAPVSPRLSSALVFRLGQEWIAIETDCIQDIATMQPVHRLPHRGGVIAGLVNVRGQLLIAIHLRELLEVDGATATQPSTTAMRIVVIEREGERWAFVADEVHGVVWYDPATEQPLAATVPPLRAAIASGTLPWSSSQATRLASANLFKCLHRKVVP